MTDLFDCALGRSGLPGVVSDVFHLVDDLSIDAVQLFLQDLRVVVPRSSPLLLLEKPLLPNITS